MAQGARIVRNYFSDHTFAGDNGGEPIRLGLGGIVLRHGNRSRIEANFILAGSNGIRIYGNDHLIVNNYTEQIGGSGIRWPGRYGDAWRPPG